MYIGALYKAGDPAQLKATWQESAELSEHLTLARDVPEARGHVLFSAEDVEDDRIGATARVVADHATARVVADHYQRPHGTTALTGPVDGRGTATSGHRGDGRPCPGPGTSTPRARRPRT